MKLEGMIRTEYGTRLAEVEATDYAAAKTALEQQVSEGELLLSMRRLDD